MLATLAVLKQHLQEQRLITIVWTVVMALLSYMVVAMAPSITADSFLLELAKSVPSGLARLYGNLFAYKYPVDAFVQFKWLMIMPVLTTVFGVLAAMRVIAREIDERTADFALSLPIARGRLLATRFTALAAQLGLLFIISYLVLWVGMRLGDIPASLPEYAAFYVGAFFASLAFSAFSLWLSVLISEYTLAVRTALITAITLWTAQLVSRTLGGPLWFEQLTIFGWVDTEAIVARSEFPWGAIAVAGSLTAIFLFLAARTIEQKQIMA